MSSSKLLSLPFVPLQKITKFMNPIDVFMLSQCSSRSLKIVQLNKLTASHCNFFMTSNYERIAVEIVFSEFIKFTCNIGVRRSYENDMIPVGKIDDDVRFFYSPLSINTIFYFTADFATNFRKIAEFLLSIFSGPLKSIELSINFYRNLNIFTSWNFFKKCDNFTLKARPRISGLNVAKLVEFVDANNSFRILSYSGNASLDISKLMNLDEVHFEDVFWIEPHQFLSLNCKRIELGRMASANSLISQAIRRWLRKEHEALEHLTVLLDFWGMESYNGIIERLSLVRWNPTKRVRYFRKNAFQIYDCSTAMDLYRDDGKIASFLYTVPYFNMFVWHQPMQNVVLSRGTCCVRRTNDTILDVKYLTPRVYRSLRGMQADTPVDLS